MSKLFDALAGDASTRRARLKITIIAVYVTIALIVCALAVFAVAHFMPPKDSGTESGTQQNGTAPQTVYTSKTVTAKELKTGNLILVNVNNGYSFSDNTAPVALTSTSYTFTPGLQANPAALAAFDKMMTALYSNVSDADIKVHTAYRSKETQDAIGSSIKGGHSDFHTGLSFELREGESEISAEGKYEWLYKNAHKYGFIVRYPNDTANKKFSDKTGIADFANVFRYVGVAHATYIYANNLCLEEYLELIRSSHKSGSALVISGADSKTYEVYYCASEGEQTTLQVPQSLSYEISGDNMSGYIVTVSK